jgi:hypothetical protein
MDTTNNSSIPQAIEDVMEEPLKLEVIGDARMAHRRRRCPHALGRGALRVMLYCSAVQSSVDEFRSQDFT